ncbi:MAG: ATP-binding protein [Methylobacter tundripaludum]|uniref:histidine kinase n=1 Tax=Methylobacter tundripaludum TaxID=173365 RepID=A0A2S6H4P6_9GAMM|nr:ATP-binding protein [Methylobacter tundripaludum]MCK9635952.1 ATP-binding protein [Methylobacter tundripaludum]PPK72390.1 phospho-acceptor domain-containing protein [Methylobacter tundripaludum]
MSRFSLSVRLTLLFSFIVLLVTTTLSAVVFYQFGEKINQQIEHNLTDTADHKAAEISNVLLFERTNLLSWRASSVMLDVVVDDLDKRITTELINLKQYYQLQGDLYVFNAEGMLIASTQPDVLKTQLPQAWQTQQDYALVFKHEVPFINGSVIAHVTALKPPQLKTQGYLVMTHSWEDISRLLAPKDSSFALHKAHEGNQGDADLFTANGVKTIEINDNFSERPVWLFDGISYLGSISKPVTVGDFSFQIAAFMPKNLALQPLLELTQNLLLAAALVGVPMLVLVGLLSRILVTPIKKLTATIHTIEDSNDLSIKVPVSGRDEVADLGNAFNRMTTRLGELFNKFVVVEKELEDLNLSLERQVIDRTAQLQDTLQKLKSAQTQLVQSEKMVSLGQLVAGIAHEINNPIGAIYANMPPLEEYIDDIKGTVEFAQSCMDEPGAEKLNTHMEQIDYTFVTEDLAKLLGSQKQAADRIRNIVLALRNFSRLDQGEVKTVRLEEGLDSTLQMLHHTYKDRITIEKDYALNEMVECYAGELNQVFMNILANAIQAIPDKGGIFITTAKVNDQAVISIADTGIGMPEEVRKKIFDPFFTTKEVGEGTGLGLSISYGIIEKHHGALTVESELNRGTRFIIAIPLRLIKDA